MTDPATFDPALVLALEDWMLLLLVHQPLLDLREGANVFAHGAARWSVSPDAKTFTFQLRPEVSFSNGRRVVAADYAYELERIADPRTASWLQIYVAGIRGFADFTSGRTNRLVGITASTPDTLVIELERPDPGFLYSINGLGYAVPREQVARAGARFGVSPVGCGPYRLAECRRGFRVVFDQNPYYAGPASNRFDRIEIMIGGDESTHLMMFERGELDIANATGVGVPLSDLRRLSRDPRWGPLIETTPGFNTTCVYLNTELPPLDNVKVRQALNYAVDKPRRMFTAARQFIPARGVIPPSAPGHDPTLKGYQFNPEKARRLLAETGLPLPLRMVLWHPNDQLSRLVTEGMQADLHDIGVEVELKAVNLAQLAEVAQTRGRIHMSYGDWNPNPDPREFIVPMFDGRTITNAATQNWSFYNNAEVNHLIDEASATVVAEKRFALFQQAERVIVADAPWIFLGYRNLFLLRQPWLKGPMLEPVGFYRLDRAWIEK